MKQLARIRILKYLKKTINRNGKRYKRRQFSFKKKNCYNTSKYEIGVIQGDLDVFSIN